MVPPIRMRVPSVKIAQGGIEQVEAPGVVNEAAAWVYQARELHGYQYYED
jgi:hypothetical protein